MKSEYEAMSKALLERFGGDNLSLEFVDTALAGLDAYPQVKEVVQAGYPFPIIAVNGDPRWAGGMALDSLTQIIIEALNAQ